jgi:uncharacterized protein (DUF2252 family)
MVEELNDTNNGAIKIRKSKNRHHNGYEKKDKQQSTNIYIKLNIGQHETH